MYLLFPGKRWVLKGATMGISPVDMVHSTLFFVGFLFVCFYATINSKAKSNDKCALYGRKLKHG